MLVSLGFNIPEVPPTEAGKDAEFERVLARVDPNGERQQPRLRSYCL